MKGNHQVTDSSNISEKWFDLVPSDDQKHLLNSLSSLSKLQPPTPSFKLYGKADWSVVTDFLASKAVSGTRPPKWLIEYEYSRESKYGPQGGHAPWSELKENADLYWSRPQPCSIVPSREVMTKYQKLSLQMSDAFTTLSALLTSGKVEERANGWRLFSLKKTDAKAQRDALHLIKTGEWKQGWAYFFSRFNKQKKRLFIPMPFSANIRQGQWFNAFLQAIQQDLRLNGPKSDFRFWGDKIGFKPLFTWIVQDEFSSAIKNNPDYPVIVYVMRDFDKMDTSTGVSQKENCFVPKVCAAFHYGKGSKSWSDVTEAMLFSNRCPIATPDGMRTGDHGEASGSTVTNGGETCCNEDYDDCLQSELRRLSHEAGIKYVSVATHGNGDDGFSAYLLRDVNAAERFSDLVRQAASFAAKKGGFIIQEDKWDIFIDTYGKYCQFLFSWEGDKIRWMYPASLILNAICNPEKQYSRAAWDKDYRDLDIITKLVNGEGLPYFTQLIDYVDNGMRFPLLGRTEDETRRILSKWDKYWSLQGGSKEYNVIDPSYYADPRDNPVVRYLTYKRKAADGKI